VPDRVTSVAVLGTGIMGSPIARNLAGAGFDVRAWNRTREKAEPLSDVATVSESPAAALDGTDVVVTMLTDGGAVRSVMEDALPAMESDTAWLQTSTVGIAATRELSQLADDRGIAFVDAPVLGTKQPAEQGELIVLASGPEGLRERLAPLFDAIGSRTVWLGQAGAGSRMKLVLNNYTLALTAGLADDRAGRDAERRSRHVPGHHRRRPHGLALRPAKGQDDARGSLRPELPARIGGQGCQADPRGIGREARAGAQQVERRFREGVEAGNGGLDMAAVYRAVRESS
jgi:3-hydroxyisobutyrate dehydrogenase